MHAWTLSLLLLATGGLLFADPYQQPTPPAPEIRGVVLETGINQPVAGAEVTLEYHGPQQPRIMPSPPKSSATAQTDASGAFVFHPATPGYFYLKVAKPGYSEMKGMPPNPVSEQDVTLTEAQLTKTVQLALSRPGEIAGTLVDAGPGKPLAGVHLQAWIVRQRPRMTVPASKTAISKANGDFSLSGLPAGDYVIEVTARRKREDRVIATFTESDIKVVEQDFEHTYWPGGHGLDAALPVSIAGGASVHIGALPLRQTGWYRVHIKFPEMNCRPGDKISVNEFQRVQEASQYLGLGGTSCRRDLLVAGFPPGEYRLLLGLNRAAGDPESASVPFSIKDKNVEVLAGFETPATVDGAFVPFEGSRLPDLSTVNVSWEPGRGILNTSAPPVKPDDKGVFQIPTFLSEPRRLQIRSLGAGAYVKEIRYNGAVVAGDFVPLNKGALSQSLTIVLDDKPAALTGTVLKAGKAVAEAVAVVARWPLPDDGGQLQTDMLFARTGSDGNFQLGGLAPGEYRAIGATVEAFINTSGLESVRRALAAAPKLELGPRAVRNLTLEAVDLR